MKEIPEMTDKQRLFCAILSVTLSISSMIVVLTKPKTIVHKADVVVPRASFFIALPPFPVSKRFQEGLTCEILCLLYS